MRDEKPKVKCVNVKKAAKRRARNKRRKKRKQEQRQKWVTAQSTTAASTGATGTTKTNTTTTQTNERRSRQSQQYNTEVNLVERAYQLWQRTYENAVRWVCTHQANYWRERALQMQKENEKLKNELSQLRQNRGEEYETSSSSSSEGARTPSPSSYFTSDEDEENADFACYQTDTEVDEGYLKFMQVTHQHWEELRQQREREQKEREQNNN